MPANLTQQLPSYPYQQYVDDPDIVAFFTAYNNFSQVNLDSINTLSLPNYQHQTGAALDWVAKSLYGQVRSTLDVGYSHIIGPLDTYNFNQLQPNQYEVIFEGTSNVVSDGVLKAILQWNNFKGDGYQFTIRWLKKRVRRFLNGNPFIQQTYDVSIVFTGDYTVTITIPTSLIYASALQAAIAGNLVLLPFQYSFTVVLV